MSNMAQHLTLQSGKDKVTPAEWKRAAPTG